MGYRLPCGKEDRGPTGDPKFPFSDLAACERAQKLLGGSSRKYKKSAKRVFRKKSRSTRRR